MKDRPYYIFKIMNRMILTPAEISNEITRLKDMYVLASFILPLSNYPNFLAYINSLGYDRGSTTNLGKQDGSYYKGLDIYAAIEKAGTNNPQYNIDYLGIQLTTIITILGDYLGSHNYFTKTPVFEFFRHIRNAVDHGNKFNLAKFKEPKRIAEFKSFKIDKNLEGKQFLFDFMRPGDVFELLDEIQITLLNMKQ